MMEIGTMAADTNGIYHPLDGWKEVEAPTRWEREIVAARIIEACLVIASEPAVTRSPGNGWPAIVRDWNDFIGRGSDHRQDVWDSWSRTRPQWDSATLSRAEEAAGWPIRYLRGQEGASRVLMAWATNAAFGRKFAALARRKKWAMTTVKRKRTLALDAIRAGLTSDRVSIREAEHARR